MKKKNRDNPSSQAITLLKTGLSRFFNMFLSLYLSRFLRKGFVEPHRYFEIKSRVRH